MSAARGIAVSGSCFWIFHSKNKIENSISQSFWHPRHRHSQHSRHGPVQPAQTALRPCCCYPCWRLKTTKLLTTQHEWVWHRQTQWCPLPRAFPSLLMVLFLLLFRADDIRSHFEWVEYLFFGVGGASSAGPGPGAADSNCQDLKVCPVRFQI